jgi:hypothetical protein
MGYGVSKRLPLLDAVLRSLVNRAWGSNSVGRLVGLPDKRFVRFHLSGNGVTQACGLFLTSAKLQTLHVGIEFGEAPGPVGRAC